MTTTKEKIYKDSTGRFNSLVVISETRGRWTAKSYSQECQEDVNALLEGKQYNGISDEEWIIELMQKHGFDWARGGRDPDRDPAPATGMIFDHIATATAAAKMLLETQQ